MRLPIFLTLIVLCLIGFVVTNCVIDFGKEPDSIRPDLSKCSREVLKTFLAQSAKNSGESYMKREEVRTQIKFLTLSLVISVIGFASTKKDEIQIPLLSVILVFIFLMFALDTFLGDISNRVLESSTRYGVAAMQADSLEFSALHDSAVAVFKGIGSSNAWRKIHLFFTQGCFAWGWYGIPMLTDGSFIFWIEYKKWKNGRSGLKEAIDRWKKKRRKKEIELHPTAK